MGFELGLVLTLTLASCIAHQRYSNVRSNGRLSYVQGYGYWNPRDRSDNLPGLAGRNYPIFRKVPRTRFECTRTGYYADPETDCQAYHVCQRGGRKDSFLCPNGTLFNQERLVCAWWYTVDCSRAQSFYSINEAVAKAMEEADRSIKVAAEEKLFRGYQRKSEIGPWYKRNRQGEQRGWYKHGAPIRHNQDSHLFKQLSYEAPAQSARFVYDAPEFSNKSLPNGNTRYNSNAPYKSNYKIIDAKFSKQATKKFTGPANVYLPV